MDRRPSSAELPTSRRLRRCGELKLFQRHGNDVLPGLTCCPATANLESPPKSQFASVDQVVGGVNALKPFERTLTKNIADDFNYAARGGLTERAEALSGEIRLTTGAEAGRGFRRVSTW